MSTDEFSNQWLCDFRLTERARMAYALAERYHSETEAYDRTVCSGPILDGAIMPIGPMELGRVNRNAAMVRERILSEARQEGLSRQEVLDAIRVLACLPPCGITARITTSLP